MATPVHLIIDPQPIILRHEPIRYPNKQSGSKIIINIISHAQHFPNCQYIKLSHLVLYIFIYVFIYFYFMYARHSVLYTLTTTQLRSGRIIRLASGEN